MPESLSLTMQELDRLQALTRIAERRLTRRRAAVLLDLSERQVCRLYKAFARDGAAALVSKRRGKPSPRRLAPSIREDAIQLIREGYADFKRHARRARLSVQIESGESAMPGKFHTVIKFECEVSKTSAELKSDTHVVLKGFDDEAMTKQHLDAAIEMLTEVSSRMREADEEPGEG